MKILMCDDESLILKDIERYCERFEQENKVPIHVIMFTDGKECLECFRKNKDVVLLTA